MFYYLLHDLKCFSTAFNNVKVKRLNALCKVNVELLSVPVLVAQIESTPLGNRVMFYTRSLTYFIL